MRTVPVDVCPVCGGGGIVVYREVPDRTFGVPGLWNLRRCRGCRSLWLDPRPTDADLYLAYRSYYTHPDEAPPLCRSVRPALERTVRVVRDAGTDAFIARRFGYPSNGALWGRVASLIVELWPARRLDAEFKIWRLQPRDRGRLLDVGCGDGVALIALHKLGWDVRGVDFDAAAVSAARARGLTVDLGSFAGQAYPDESFDVVTMSHFLEHVPDPAVVLEEARRVLRPGGRLVVLTPNAASWLHERYGRDWLPLDPPRHLQIFMPAALAELTRHGAFDEIDVATTERSANRVALAARKFRRHGRWDARSRTSFRERVLMETIQLWEGLKIRRQPEAGEELVLTAIRPGR